MTVCCARGCDEDLENAEWGMRKLLEMCVIFRGGSHVPLPFFTSAGWRSPGDSLRIHEMSIQESEDHEGGRRA
jgi:hypothetical protein